jgi:parallel beta-helix repeat protein
MFKRLLAALLGVILLISPSVKPARAEAYTVTNTNDSGVGSLRWAINQANANPGPDTIDFNITSGTCEDGVCTISPDTYLPVLIDDGTTIDGYTQTGASPASDTARAVIVVRIDGRGIINNNGFNIVSANNRIQGLAITNFNGIGIAIGTTPEGSGSGNVIAGNYIGVHADGLGDGGNGLGGVFIGFGATNNLVGGETPADRNVISGNGLDGVAIHNIGTDGNTVSGNYIGSDHTGADALPNDQHGVHIYGGAQDNTIGGDTTGERNIIAGNSGDGVHILGASTTGNTVSGNFIGVDKNGYGLGNGDQGVGIDDAGSNTIGPNNTISDNLGGGVRIINTNASGNVVRENHIGTRVGARLALPNHGVGVYIVDALDNTVGPGNVISGNGSLGVWIDDADGNTVSGNIIGLDIDGASAIPNLSSGVFIGDGSINNLIGGDSPAERNIISGNFGSGILLADAGTADNTISGNTIGLGAAGTNVLGNEDEGINIGQWVQDITIGGLTPGERNVISGNEGGGIRLAGTDVIGILIQGNYIGTDATGSIDRGNNLSGVAIGYGAHENTVGGDTPSARNLISGNDGAGVELLGPDTTDNVVSGNYIGTDVDGAAAIGNDQAGVEISDGASFNTVGGDTAGERNILSGNRYGVLISGEDCLNNFIEGNYIGTSATRREALGNQMDGVHITFGADHNSIGPGNTIAHNMADGVRIDTPTAYANLVFMNSIFDNFDLGIDLTNGANHEIQPPMIESSTVIPFSVSGSACAGCAVDLYCSQDGDGEGEIWLWRVLADSSGDFTLALDVPPFPYLTATASKSTDGTSEFSAVFSAQLPDMVYMPALWR